MTDYFIPILAAAAIFIGPFVALAALAMRYGADSRPGVDDQRAWLVPSA
jgi:hypothetical protein